MFPAPPPPCVPESAKRAEGHSSGPETSAPARTVHSGTARVGEAGSGGAPRRTAASSIGATPTNSTLSGAEPAARWDVAGVGQHHPAERAGDGDLFGTGGHRVLGAVAVIWAGAYTDDGLVFAREDGLLRYPTVVTHRFD